MSLTTILSEINSLKPFVNEDVDSGPIETMTARRGRKRQAEDNLKRLREQYIQDLLRSSVFILVTGAARDEFAAVANEKFGCFSANPEGFYNELAARFPEGLLGREAPASLFDILGRHLEDVANDMGVLGYPQMIFKAHYDRPVTSKTELVQLIKAAINEQVGGELAGVYAVRSIADKAIELNHDAPITPIVLATDDEKLVTDLSDALTRLTPRVFVATAGKTTKTAKALATVSVKEATEETVLEALTTIKSNLKK